MVGWENREEEAHSASAAKKEITIFHVPETNDVRGPWWKYVTVRVVLLVIPAGVVTLLFWIKGLRGPMWLALNHDPSYHYLLNSLMIAEGHAPYHFDNPGTPLQVLGAIVIRVTHLFRGIDSMRLDVLQHPETYLAALHTVLVLFLGVVLLLTGWVTLRITKSVISAFLIQLAPVLAHQSLIRVARITPETFQMSIATILCLVVVVYLWRPPEYEGKRTDSAFAIIFAVVVGFGTATKLTFAPLAFAPLVLMRRLRVKLIYLAALPVTLIILTLPAMANYPRIVAWYKRWVTHAGAYGGGEEGLFGFEQVRALFRLLTESPLLPATLLIIVAAYAWIWHRGRKETLPGHCQRIQRGFLALAVVVVVQYLMLLKQPRYHYLVPALSFLGLAGLLLFEVSGFLLARRRRLRVSLVLVFLAVLSIICYRDFKLWAQSFPAVTMRSVSIHREMEQRFPDAAKVYFFRASSKAYAFSVSSVRSDYFFAEDLRHMYPKSFFWNFWKKRYEHFGKTVTLEEIATKSEEVVFQGERLNRNWHDHLPIAVPDGAVLELVQPGNFEAIYRLKARMRDPKTAGIVLDEKRPAGEEVKQRQRRLAVAIVEFLNKKTKNSVSYKLRNAIPKMDPESPIAGKTATLVCPKSRMPGRGWRG